MFKPTDELLEKIEQSKNQVTELCNEYAKTTEEITKDNLLSSINRIKYNLFEEILDSAILQHFEEVVNRFKEVKENGLNLEENRYGKYFIDKRRVRKNWK